MIHVFTDDELRERDRRLVVETTLYYNANGNPWRDVEFDAIRNLAAEPQS